MNKNKVMEYGKKVRDLLGAAVDLDKLLQSVQADQLNGERGTLSLEYEGRNGKGYRPADRAVYAKYRRVACDIFGSGNSLGLLYRLTEAENSDIETYNARADLIYDRLINDYLKEMNGDGAAIAADLKLFISEITLDDFPQAKPAPVLVLDNETHQTVTDERQRTLAAHFTIIAPGAAALSAALEESDELKTAARSIIEEISKSAFRVMNQEPPKRYDQIPRTAFSGIFEKGLKKQDFVLHDKNGAELVTPYCEWDGFKAMIDKKCFEKLPPILKEPADKIRTRIDPAFLEAHYPTDGKVVIDFDDYCNKCGIDISTEYALKQAKYSIRRMLSAFKAITWGAEDRRGNYIECSFVADHGIIDRGAMIIWLAPNYCNVLKRHNSVVLMPRPLYRLTDHTAPGQKSTGKAYTVGKMICEHAYMYSNIQRGTHDILSVKSILTALDMDKPTIDDLKRWNDRIKTPIDNALETLIDAGILKEYHYSREKHKLLTDDELYDLENNGDTKKWSFYDYEAIYIVFKVTDTPPQIVQKVKERKQAAADKKALEAAAVLDAKGKIRRTRNATKK